MRISSIFLLLGIYFFFRIKTVTGAKVRTFEHRRLAGFDAMGGAAHRGSRIDRHHLPRHQPVEQMPDCGQALLDGRRGQLPRLRLAPCRHMERLHGGERGHPRSFAPGEEAGYGAVAGSGDERGKRRPMNDNRS